MRSEKYRVIPSWHDKKGERESMTVLIRSWLALFGRSRVACKVVHTCTMTWPDRGRVRTNLNVLLRCCRHRLPLPVQPRQVFTKLFFKLIRPRSLSVKLFPRLGKLGLPRRSHVSSESSEVCSVAILSNQVSKQSLELGECDATRESRFGCWRGRGHQRRVAARWRRRLCCS
jgi:hypothetical protein